MKLLKIFLLIFLPYSLMGQGIKKISYQGNNLLVYPDSIITTSERITLMKNLPDGKYIGFLKGDTSWLRLNITYLNNEINGEVIEYYSNPPIATYLTTYKNGIKDGHWIEFSDDTILREGYFVNGKRDGFEYSYTGHKGRKYVYNKCYYKNDTLKYSIWNKYDSTYYVGDIGYLFESNYTRKLLGYGKTLNGYKFGLWKEFYENGQLKSIGNYEIIKHSESHSESCKQGKWIDYHMNGRISREYICDPQSMGIYDKIATVICQYDNSGSLIDSNKFIDGKGHYREFFPDGKLKVDSYYSDPSVYDYLKLFYDNGKLKLYDRFEKEKNRILINYYENGNIRSIERYKCTIYSGALIKIDALHHGKQEYYNEDGTVMKIENYKNGILLQ